MRAMIRLVLLFFLASTAADAGQPLHRILKSGGRRIPVEIRVPRSLPAPAVVILPGRAGTTFYSAHLRDLATGLVSRGFVVVTPAYMGRSPSDVPKVVDSATFSLWTRTVRDLVSLTARLPMVRQDRIGVSGFSLGAFAASVAAARDGRIQALVLNSAGLSDYFPQDTRRMPPTLIAVASDDPIVPRKSVDELRDRICNLGGYAEVQLYDSDQHILTGAEWTIALEQNLGFLARFLGRKHPLARSLSCPAYVSAPLL